MRWRGGSATGLSNAPAIIALEKMVDHQRQLGHPHRAVPFHRDMAVRTQRRFEILNGSLQIVGHASMIIAKKGPLCGSKRPVDITVENGEQRPPVNGCSVLGGWDAEFLENTVAYGRRVVLAAAIDFNDLAGDQFGDWVITVGELKLLQGAFISCAKPLNVGFAE